MECLREYPVRAADYFADGGADNAEGVRKRTFRALGRFLGGISVYSGHDIFIRGIEQKRRLKLTFFSMEHQRNLGRQCAPLHYSKSKTKGDDLDHYYIWDFEATKGNNFLALPQSQIVSMELTEDTFRTEDFVDFKTIRKQVNKKPSNSDQSQS